MSLDFRFNIFILLFNHINFRIEHVDVVVKRVILFFSFNKGCNDFLSGWNSSLLFDLRKSVFDNIYISNIHIHQIFLFFIIASPFLESKFQESDWIRELSGWYSCGILQCSSESSCFWFLQISVISLFKFVLKIFYFHLKI